MQMTEGKLTRRTFVRLGALAAGAEVLAANAAAARTRDESLAAFISDLHVNGEKPEPTYQREYLARCVRSILALDPLPAQVVCFGDISHFWGYAADYVAAKKLLQPIVDAGIRLTLGMGNHDHREHFLASWPEYAKSSPVPGRIVSKVAFPHSDLILLDSLNAKPLVPNGEMYLGEIGKEQLDWLLSEIGKSTRPVFLGAHHKPEDLGLVRHLVGKSSVAGFIHGHYHWWGGSICETEGTDSRTLWKAGLPSTGAWGDIGFALFRVGAGRAELTCRMEDFFYPAPLPAKKRPPLWDVLRRTRHGQKVSFGF